MVDVETVSSKAGGVPGSAPQCPRSEAASDLGMPDVVFEVPEPYPMLQLARDHGAAVPARIPNLWASAIRASSPARSYPWSGPEAHSPPRAGAPDATAGAR
jgi:hypothetical protein